MTPQPKRKHSKSRTHLRRAHDALSAVKLVRCPSCRNLHPSHRVCPTCGNYHGREAIEVESES